VVLRERIVGIAGVVQVVGLAVALGEQLVCEPPLHVLHPASRDFTAVESLAGDEIVNEMPHTPTGVQHPLVVGPVVVEEVSLPRGDYVVAEFQPRVDPGGVGLVGQHKHGQPDGGRHHRAAVAEIGPVQMDLVSGTHDDRVYVRDDFVAHDLPLCLGRVRKKQVVSECERPQTQRRIEVIAIESVVVYQVHRHVATHRPRAFVLGALEKRRHSQHRNRRQPVVVVQNAGLVVSRVNKVHHHAHEGVGVVVVPAVADFVVKCR
jgi:hypothetical protein